MTERESLIAVSDGCHKPRLLDLFCGAGGCSVGYDRAGFEVVGVDIVPQPTGNIGLVPPCAHHWQTPRFRSLDKRRGMKSVVEVVGTGSKHDTRGLIGVHGPYSGERALRERAMDIDWMSPYELTQAIPPAYTEFIGTQLLRALSQGVAA